MTGKPFLLIPNKKDIFSKYRKMEHDDSSVLGIKIFTGCFLILCVCDLVLTG